MPKIPEKKHRTWPKVLIIIGALILIVGVYFAIDYSVYANRVDGYYYYKDNASVYDTLVDEFVGKYDDAELEYIYILNNAEALSYGAGNKVLVYRIVDGSEQITSYKIYENYFSKDAAKLLDNLFRHTITARIVVEKTQSGNFRIDFCEEQNKMNMEMILSYLSETISEENAKMYYGETGDKIYQVLSGNWYYVQDMFD